MNEKEMNQSVKIRENWTTLYGAQEDWWNVSADNCNVSVL